MFDNELMQMLNPTFLFGFVGGACITAILAWGVISYAQDKMKRTSLKRWEKVVCAFFSAFVVSLSWGLYNGGIDWTKIPGNVIVYGTISGFLWENVIRPWMAKVKG